jgi:hypothetical protein
VVVASGQGFYGLGLSMEYVWRATGLRLVVRLLNDEHLYATGQKGEMVK